MRFAYAGGTKPLDGYTIKRGIGVGGFGEVYFALSDAGKEVALKRIQRNLDVELRGVKQCINLKHINLISLWDIRTNEDGESWVVMEYVPGPSLRDVVIANPKGLPEKDVKEWFCSTAAGVAYLHDQDIVHRDLKPGNIFYDEDQQIIKIGDYGLSKYMKHSRRSGQTESVGTFHYMAPEIGKGVYGREIDIYALGIILFELLTGQIPFEGESSQEIIMRHLMDSPNLEGIPEPFHQCITKALAKDPTMRYHNVPEMCSDLPWEEIAANSKDIVKRAAVGPVVLNGYSDRPNLARTSHIQPTSYKDTKKDTTVPSMLISDRPEIVFGELRDSSEVKTHQDSNGKSSPQEVNIAAESNGTSDRDDLVQILKTSQIASPNSATMPGNVNEPVARAVKTGMDQVVHWWNNANVSTPVKVAGLIAATAAIIKNSEWLLPCSLALGFLYLIYYVCYNLVKTGNADSDENPKISKWEAKKIQSATVRTWLGERESSDRTMELIGSLLIGAVACAVFNLLALAVRGSIFDATIQSWATFAWLTITSLGATWCLLVCSKIWEHREGDQWLRRLTLAVVGIGTGVLAFSVAGSLNVDLTRMTGTEFNPLRSTQFVIEGMPLLVAYLILFCTLFGILRWWKQSDPIRRTRLSTWAVGLCLVWAAILSHVLDLNPLWNCTLAAVISISVQLASPWLHPEDRQKIELQTASLASK